MDCQKSKELLDSYLSGELLVETIHEVQHHLEHCPACRAELEARRHLRSLLQQSAAQTKLPPAAHERLRLRLQAAGQADSATSAGNAAPVATAASPRNWLGCPRNWLGWLMPWRFAYPGLALTAIVLLGLGVLIGSLLRGAPTEAAVLSPQVFAQAAKEHDLCSTFYRDHDDPAKMAEAAVAYDATYAGLDVLVRGVLPGSKLHAAHKCNLVGRNFAHLLLSREQALFSILVTERDAEAVFTGRVPTDDGTIAGLQDRQTESCTVSAYQTKRHVVFVVSKLPLDENRKLAQQLGDRLSQHLRKAESQTPAR